MGELRFILRFKEPDWADKNFNNIPMLGSTEMFCVPKDNTIEVQHVVYDEFIKYLLDTGIKQEEHFTVANKVLE